MRSGLDAEVHARCARGTQELANSFNANKDVKNVKRASLAADEELEMFVEGFDFVSEHALAQEYLIAAASSFSAV